MLQPKFNYKMKPMKGPMHRKLTNWKKHAIYGGSAALGATLGMMTAPSLAEDYAHQYASSRQFGNAAARIIRNDDRRDLPGPRSPAFYGHRYSHLLPQGAYNAAMRHGTQAQQAAAGFVP